MAETKGRGRAKPRNRQQQADAEDIQYYVRANDGDFVIEIPAHWKVTFGYVSPGNPERGYGGQSAHCLRVYEGEKLRGVWAGVQGIRDLSIKLARKHSKEVGETKWERDDSRIERSELVERSTEFKAEDLKGGVQF